MMTELLLAFSLGDWFRDACNELTYYFGHMNKTQWGIVSACSVAFGFLCLKGTGINR
ncbi:hypothetical protein [Novipirellula caenicola]|uniref:Uncharacterized protein n=1 Tax=Novipirellula caenicola TaxID=1536901 RepID=A0ABP9VPJ2_9BACT